MACLVLARKWRPHTFADVIGQEHVTVTLRNAIKKDRLASAYIFSGPRGVGKTSTARILAKALNCEKGPTTDPCNECDICKEINSGNSIDVLEIDGASNRGIDEIRNLRESTRYSSAQQRSKVYIIDEVHMLTTEAFNALLKTLEEPPPHVIFIFATTEANKVPATILSRCQRFDFRRIPAEKIAEQLDKICQAEKIEIDSLSLSLIAGKSEGCMRDSQSLLDQVISFCGEKIEEKDVAGLLGIIGLDVYVEIMAAITERNSAWIFEISGKVYDNGYSYSDLLNGLAGYVNNLLICKTTGAIRLLEEKQDLIETFKEQAGKFEETDLIRIYQAIVEAINDLRWSSNPQLHVEMLLIRLTKMVKSIEFKKLIDDLDSLKKKDLIEAPVPAPESVRIVPEIQPPKVHGGLFGELNGLQKISAKESASPAKTVENKIADVQDFKLSIADIRAKWPQALAAIKKKKISIGSFLEEGELGSLTGNQLEIRFDSSKKFHVKALNENRISLQRQLSEFFDHQVLIDFVIADKVSQEKIVSVGEKTPPEQDQVLANDPRNGKTATTSSNDWIKNYPAAQMLIESLDGEEIN